jgi:hypothetical protein
MVMDIIIDHYQGQVPTSMTAADNMLELIKKDCGLIDFHFKANFHIHLLDPRKANSIEPFRALPGMMGYTPDLAPLRGWVALQKVSRRPIAPQKSNPPQKSMLTLLRLSADGRPPRSPATWHRARKSDPYRSYRCTSTRKHSFSGASDHSHLRSQVYLSI